MGTNLLLRRATQILLAGMLQMLFAAPVKLYAQNYQQMIKLIENDRNIQTESGRGSNEGIGCSSAISGDYAIVGGYRTATDSAGLNFRSEAGIAFIFYRTGGVWTLQQKIVASDRTGGDAFGTSVAIDGDYVVVGASSNDSSALGAPYISGAGAAYIFKRNGTTWTQQQKIVASDRTADDKFGCSVSISGSYVVVGAYQQDSSATGAPYVNTAGAAYIFSRNGTTWTQQQKIVASDRTAADKFGISVAISGDYIIVGANQQTTSAIGTAIMAFAGAAYVYNRSGSTWSQTQKIVASDRSSYDYFGNAVALNGSYAIIGALGNEFNAAGGAPIGEAGAAYIFFLSGTTWSQQQKIVASDRTASDAFGYSVAINDNYAMVGAYTQDSSATGAPYLSNAGAAYIYSRNGTTWSQQQKIVNSDRAASDWFGAGVAINDDYAFAGALNQGAASYPGGPAVSVSGAAYIYGRNGTTWSEQKKMVNTAAAITDNFGYAVAVDGNYAIVGAYNEDEDAAGANGKNNAGAAYIFYRGAGGVWTFQQKIVAADRTTSDFFGGAVSISGDYAIVGAEANDSASGLPYVIDAGAAYIFVRNGTTWTQQQKIVASDRTTTDNFGETVAISGDYAVVGAPRQDSSATGLPYVSTAGAAYIFVRNGTTWSQQQKIVASDRTANDNFATAIAISGDYVLIGAYGQDSSASGTPVVNNAGAAYVFVRNGTTWSQQQKIVSGDRTANDNFGWSVAINGNYAVVSAYQQDSSASGAPYVNGAGAAYIYVRNGAVWSQQQKIVASDRTAGDLFGYSVGISGNYLIVGASSQDSSATGAPYASSAGAAYIYARSGTTWSQLQKIVATDRTASDNFGSAVAISGSYVLVGAYNQDSSASGAPYISNAGASYMFELGINPLALQSVNASAVKHGANIDVQWTVTGQEDISAYEVERSDDAREFGKLATTLAVGNNGYSYTDQAPLDGSNYYRIKAIERNGNTLYSNIVRVVGNGDDLLFTVYPNPVAAGSVQISMAHLAQGSYTIRLYNAAGQKLGARQISYESGSQAVSMDISSMPAGLYMVMLTNEQGATVAARKIMKQ